MNREPVQATFGRFEQEDYCLPDKGVPGQLELDLERNRIIMACPGCGHVSSMRVGNPKPADSPSWLITGLLMPDGETMQDTTLHPSVNCIGCCGWHGWLKQGVFAL